MLDATIHILFFRLIISLLHNTTIDYSLKIDYIYYYRNQIFINSRGISWELIFNFLFSKKHIKDTIKINNNVPILINDPVLFNNNMLNKKDNITYIKKIIDHYIKNKQNQNPPLIYIINILHNYIKDNNDLFNIYYDNIFTDDLNIESNNIPITIKNSLYLLNNVSDNKDFQYLKIYESYCLGLYYNGILPCIDIEASCKYRLFFENQNIINQVYMLNTNQIPYPFNYITLFIQMLILMLIIIMC